MTWLAAYEPEGDRERTDVDRLTAALAYGDVWSRSTPLHVTGSALVVDPATKQVLLRWHQRYSLWNHVGGHADSDERDPWPVARREAIEETGLTDLAPWPGPEPAIALVQIVPVPAAKDEADHEHADVCYLLATRRPHATVEEHGDAALEWVDLDEARRRVNDHVAVLIDRVARHLL